MLFTNSKLEKGMFSFSDISRMAIEIVSKNIDIRNAQITRDCSYLIITGVISKTDSSGLTRGYFFIILDIENNFVAKYYKFWDDI